jgi:hypothetical protein
MKFLLLMNVARRALVRAGQGSNLRCEAWPVVSVARYLDVAGSNLLPQDQQSERAMWKGTSTCSDGRSRYAT